MMSHETVYIPIDWTQQAFYFILQQVFLQLLDVQTFKFLLVLSYKQEFKENYVYLNFVSYLYPLYSAQFLGKLLCAFVGLPYEVLNVVQGNQTGLRNHSWLSDIPAQSFSVQSDLLYHILSTHHHRTDR